MLTRLGKAAQEKRKADMENQEHKDDSRPRDCGPEDAVREHPATGAPGEHGKGNILSIIKVPQASPNRRRLTKNCTFL